MAKARGPRRRRLAVTLSPETEALVVEVATLTGQPQAAIVSEMMDAAAGALQTMIGALRVAKETPLEAQRLLARYANQATLGLAQAQLDLDAHIDGRTVQGKRRRAARGAT